MGITREQIIENLRKSKLDWDKRDEQKASQRRIEEELERRSVPEWQQIADDIGIDITGMGGVLVAPSESLSSRMTPNQRSEISDLATYYGHFSGNPNAAKKSGITPEELEKKHQLLNTRWKELTGINYDDFLLLRSVFRDYLGNKMDKEQAARQVGISDLYVAKPITREEINAQKEKLITDEAIQNLLSAIKGK